ncbi:MAG: hypothetical protein WB764_29995 [Xanthobacteraceae bacterium]
MTKHKILTLPPEAKASDEVARLRTITSDLIEAAQAVIDNWERGDLAGAVRGLDAAIREARDELE